MFMQRPLLLPLVAMVLGLVSSYLGAFTVTDSMFFASVIILFLTVFISNPIPFILSLLLFFCLWGNYALSFWLSPVMDSHSIRNYSSSKPNVVEGVVISRPVTSGERTSFMLRSRQIIIANKAYPVNGTLLVFIPGAKCLAVRGDYIRCEGKVGIPRRLGLAGEFDYARYLAMQGIAATIQLGNFRKVAVIGGKKQDGFLRWTDDIAMKFSSFIDSSVKNEQAAAVLKALLIGDQKKISPELNSAYSRAGVNHILSISGFHVGIIAFVVSITFTTLLCQSQILALRFNLRHLSLFCALPFMLWYLFITGAAAATSRAVIMLVIVAATLLIERESDGINSLIIAAFLLIILYPPVLFDVSFQLSFCALWGIIVFMDMTERITAKIEKTWQRQIMVFMLVSLAASIFTAVPVLFTFHQASLNGLLANFIIVPLLGYGATVLGFAGLVFSFVSLPLSSILLIFAGWLTTAANDMTLIFARLPVFTSYSVTSLDMALFLFFIFSITFVPHKRLRLIFSILIPIIAIIIHIAGDKTSNDGKLHVTMLSVGQAESIYIKLPDGKNVLVDAGGYLQESEHDFGERILAPALYSMGVKRLDTIILTHNHPDHMGGIPYLLDRFNVGQFLQSDISSKSLDFRDSVMKAIRNKKIASRNIFAGMTLQLSKNVTIEILSPSKDDAELSANQDLNEKSVVFRLLYGNFKMLFTADAGFETEQRLLKQNIPLSATVLKVGHHGSRYSTNNEFLNRVNPKIALISAGYENRFALPADDTLQQLKGFGIKVYRTDLDGSIEIITDGNDLKVDTPFNLKTAVQ